MEFIEGSSLSVAGFYLGFFVVSFVILSLIVLSGFPGIIKRSTHAFRLLRARRRREVRMLADREALDIAGEELEGLTLFDSRPDEDQVGAEARVDISDAA